MTRVSTQTLLTGVELKAWSNFLRAHAAIRRQLDRELVTGHGLTISDFEVLYRLADAPNKMLRRVDLAQNVLLAPMESRGQERFPSPTLTVRECRWGGLAERIPTCWQGGGLRGLRLP